MSTKKSVQYHKASDSRLNLDQIAENYLEKQTQNYEEVLLKGLEARRKIFVYEIADRIHRHYQVPKSGDTSSGKLAESVWLPIESLSSLRATVGGRFQQLKERWVEAGLPLREHRGDRSAGAVIDQKGWIELTNWMLKQGFEARSVTEKVTESENEVLFEVRKLIS